MILLISGSGIPASRTLALVAAAGDAIARCGTRCEVWDLADRPLPAADGRHHEAPESHPDPLVRELVRTAREASGFVLASPVHHNSYSGLIKNCLDHLAIEHFEYKPVALMAFGGSMAAIQVCDHLRIVVRGLWGIALPGQAVAVPSDFEEAPGGDVTVAAGPLRQRLDLLARDLVRYAKVADALVGANGRARR